MVTWCGGSYYKALLRCPCCPAATGGSQSVTEPQSATVPVLRCLVRAGLSVERLPHGCVSRGSQMRARLLPVRAGLHVAHACLCQGGQSQVLRLPLSPPSLASLARLPRSPPSLALLPRLSLSPPSLSSLALLPLSPPSLSSLARHPLSPPSRVPAREAREGGERGRRVGFGPAVARRSGSAGVP